MVLPGLAAVGCPRGAAVPLLEHRARLVGLSLHAHKEIQTPSQVLEALYAQSPAGRPDSFPHQPTGSASAALASLLLSVGRLPFPLA